MQVRYFFTGFSYQLQMSLFVTLLAVFIPCSANWWYLGASSFQSQSPFSDISNDGFYQKNLFTSSLDRNSPYSSPLVQVNPSLREMAAHQRAIANHEIIRKVDNQPTQINRLLYNPINTRKLCERLKLVGEQLDVCTKNPHFMFAVTKGAHLGFEECQQQFRNERWNCTPESDDQVFDRNMLRGSREIAFVHAITSAGVAYAVTQACSSGSFAECSCDRSYTDGVARRPPTLPTDENLHGKKPIWKWGGCSDNIRYGIQFAKRFVDAQELPNTSRRSIRAVMNLHNNKAGREALKKRMQLKCRCHGVSGSCELKTCWRTLPDFEEIGKYLKEKYQQSVHISMDVGGKSVTLRRKRRGRKQKLLAMNDEPAPSKEDLVYIAKSPNYCEPDARNGILGTSGRRCDLQSNGPDSCDLLCCGRGYNTHVYRTMEQCDCKFQWCCEVTCKTCEKTVKIYTCK